MRHDKKNSWRVPSTIALIGFTVFLSIIFLMHFIHPELSFSSHYVSEYANEEYGWILNIAIIGNLIGSIAFIIAVYRAYPPPYRSMISIIIYGIATFAILTNFFPMDPPGESVTLSGQIHNMGGFIGGLAGLVFFIIHSIRLHSFGVLQGFYRILLILAIFGFIMFVVVLIAAIYADGIIGIVQRIYVLVLMSWLIIAANGIRTEALVLKNLSICDQ
ncbi:MAG: DUF998 domain-containing protein [Thermoplasmata archaeon]|nr:MAG: DUF998 domain-containing protein [Thermoplasmata archaeon]